MQVTQDRKKKPIVPGTANGHRRSKTDGGTGNNQPLPEEMKAMKAQLEQF